jgi:taurine dioxygenase
MLHHLVLLVRGQKLDELEQTAFTARFGSLENPPVKSASQKDRDPRFPHISVISNVKENGTPIGALGDGEASWHTDTSYAETPPSFTTLHSLEIPPTGGDTSFTNMYAALDTLPRDLRKRIEGRTLKHDAVHNAGGELHAGAAEPKDVISCPGRNHPIIRTHPETGHHALYLGRRLNGYINGLSIEESEELLTALWRHSTRPELTWTQQWRLGDIIIWDNRCVMHRRDAFDPNTRRIMHKSVCKGTTPAYITSSAAHLAHLRADLRRY